MNREKCAAKRGSWSLNKSSFFIFIFLFCIANKSNDLIMIDSTLYLLPPSENYVGHSVYSALEISIANIVIILYYGYYPCNMRIYLNILSIYSHCDEKKIENKTFVTMRVYVIRTHARRNTRNTQEENIVICKIIEITGNRGHVQSNNSKNNKSRHWRVTWRKIENLVSAYITLS